MKKLLILISFFIPLIGCSKDEGRFSEMLTMVRNIEGGLHGEFLSEGKQLPTSLNEIELLKEIVGRNPSSGVLLNEMAIVPGAPLIVEAPGILRHHYQWRIFAVGRTVNTDQGSYKGADGKDMPGRYSVWISPDGTYCSPGWIPETEVQAVFKQIGGFDPSEQPLAFPDAAKSAMEEKEGKRKFHEQIREDLRRNRKRTPKEGITSGSTPDVGKHSGLTWLMIGLPVLALLVWLVIYVAGKRSNA